MLVQTAEEIFSDAPSARLLPSSIIRPAPRGLFRLVASKRSPDPRAFSTDEKAGLSQLTLEPDSPWRWSPRTTWSPGAAHPRGATLFFMSRILITGMSGAGKTTVLRELSRRGHRTVDTDYDGWVLPDGTWDEPRISALLASSSSLVVSGTVENQVRFYHRFSAVVLLSAPVEVLIQRVSIRTNNTYGRSEADQSAIRQYVLDVEPLLRDGATLELDACRPVADLADDVERIMAESGHM